MKQGLHSEYILFTQRAEKQKLQPNLFVAGMPAMCYNIIKAQLRSNNVKASSFGSYLRKLSIDDLHAKLLEYEASGFKKAVL